MGRALFSTIYTQPVAVRTEPDVPDHSDLPRCEKWSISNPFDPDSDEFYKSATREVFTDTEAWRNEQAALRELLTAQAVRASIESSSSSEASESDSGSPMAVGSDDPAQLIADAFPDSDWASQLGAPADMATISKSNTSLSTAMFNSGPAARSQLRATRRSLGFIPPSAEELATPSPPQSPIFRRTVPITPIIIPNEPSSHSPPSPATPADNVVVSMLTPSPAPHVYAWRPTPLAAPPSPLASLSNPAGPLTNPGARLSFVSLNVRPTIVRAQNAAV
ncbi:hypothetical protein J132_04636 [Termitomyces sp. J132]|nr:hypothetical protein C0989_010762 [Termitomyces sp. Mn162]KNZ75151.1 hypothetical protein J132_04636 [Termitomyces sp. J132]